MTRHLPAGATIADKYRLLELLGCGGMGDVYRAENRLAGRIVALKLLRPEFAANEDLTRRFFLEAQAANRIRHPNIVDVIDAGFSSLGPYLAMECLEGCNLSHVLATEQRLDAATALAVVIPTLSALDAAHRQGIVHRDLKPQNIFIAEIGGEVRVKLLDFGIAKVASTSSGVEACTSAGVIFGTPDYLSPEQAAGECGVDGRSDIFAMGTVLFELLTGKRPFEAPSAIATAYKVVHAAAPTLASAQVDVSPVLQAALDTAFAKDRGQRFPSAADFIDALAPATPQAASRREALGALLKRVLDRDAARGPAALDAVAVALQEARFPVAAAGARDPAATRASVPSMLEGMGPLTPTQQSAQQSDAPAPWLRRVSPVEITGQYGDAQRLLLLQQRPAPHPSTATTGPSAEARAPGSAAPSPQRAAAGRWIPRPLPSSLRGRYHVRGTLPRAVSLWVARAHGDGKLAAVLDLLPADLADSARSNAFNALVWYDLEAVDTLIEAATLVANGGDASAWRALARNNFMRDFGPIFRPAGRAVDGAASLRRAQSVWTKLFDFGVVSVIETPRKCLVRVEGFDAASLALRNIMVGTLEGLAERAGRVVAGEASFARDFEVEFPL